MAHVSLYRKYRPGSFAEVVGQDHVTTTLARAVDSGSWHHAYLFTGPRGTGKTSSARIFAMALNASDGPTSTPPEDDPMIEAIRTGTAPDVIEIDAASNNKVEDVRDLVDRVAFSPAIARQKVYIVDECHMLTTQAWNAFLKTIEEPPGHVVFIFATTEPHKVLPTVLSRTQRFDFRRVPAKILSDHCRRIGDLEGFTFADDALAAIVRAGDGSVRDTLSVLDQVVAFTGTDVTAQGVADVLGSVPANLLDELADRLAASDIAGVLGLVDRVADGGTDLRQFATDAVEHLRSLLLLSAAPDAGLVEATPDRLAELAAQAARTGPADLLRAVEMLNDAQPKMRRGNTRLPLEIALAKAALPESAGDPAAIAARIDRLEARIAEGGQSMGRGMGRATVVPPASVAPSSAAEVDPADAEAPVTETASAETASAETAPTQASRAGSARAPSPGAEPAPTQPGSAQPGSAQSESTPAPAAAPSPAASQPVVTASAPERSKASDAPSAEPAAGLADDGPSPAGDADGATATPADDLTTISKAWPAILEALQSSSRRFGAIFGEGTPVSASNGILTLEFAFDFHAQQAEDGDGATTITGILQTVVGRPYRIRAIVGGKEDEDPSAVVVDDEASAVINREAAEAAGETVDQDAIHDAAITTLTRVLGAEVVSDSSAS